MHQALKNYVSLNILQGLNMIVPLISYPLIINRVGLNLFGELVLLQTIFGISNIYILFGTNYTSVKEISIYKDNDRILSNVIASTLLIRWFNSLVSLVFILLLNKIFSFSNNVELVFYSLGFVAFEVFVPTWYYQGFEKIFKLNSLNLLIKSLYLLTIYLFLNDTNIELVPKAMLVSTLIISSFPLYNILRSHLSQKFLRVNFFKIFLRKSSQLFAASFFSTLYTLSNKLIIGMYLNKEILAMYEIADKASIALKTPIQMVSKALLPNLGKKRNKTRNKFFILCLILSIILTIISYFISPFLVELLGGNETTLSSEILRILVLTIPFVLISLFNLDLFLVLENRFKKIISVRFYTLLFYSVGISSYLILFQQRINPIHLALIYLSTEVFTSIISMPKKRWF